MSSSLSIKFARRGSLDNPGGEGYTKAVYWNCEDGKQYPVCESQERARLVEALVQRPAKSSRSTGAERGSKLRRHPTVKGEGREGAR